MSTTNKTDYIIGTPEYDRGFWNAMRGKGASAIDDGYIANTGMYALPTAAGGKLSKAIDRDSVFRNLATVVRATGSGYRLETKDCDDIAAWVPDGEAIPIYDGMDDFTRLTVDSHKLAVFVKLDEDFVRDASFDIEDYLTARLARNFNFAEEKAFISGTGENEPTGILAPGKGAELALVVDEVTADDIIRLYFTLDRQYRRNAVWMMNDNTAMALRQLKDDAGDYLWRSTDDTIFGKKVIVSEYMPDADSGEMPIVFGDLSYYWIIDRKPVSVRTLTEKFALNQQIGYLACEYLDAKLIRRQAVQAIAITNRD